MKTKLTALLTCMVALFLAINTGNAQQQLVHFWDFNHTHTYSGNGGDSLGTALSYSNPVLAATDSSFSLYADYSRLFSANPKIVYSRPQGIQTTPLVCTIRDSVLDNGAGGAFNYDFSAQQYNYFNVSDSSYGGGNMYVRTRNPAENAEAYMYIPTTGWDNIHLDFAISASSTKGSRYLIFNYSTNGGTTWKNLTTAMDTFNIHSVYRPDTLQAINPTTAGSLWYPVQMNFSSDPSVNNNPNFVLRWQFEGLASNGGSGNNRFDNFAVFGDSNTAGIVAYINNRINVTSCYGDSNGSATVIVKGGTLPYTYSWSSNATNSGAAGGLTTATAFGLKAGTYTVTVTDNFDNAAFAYVTILQPTQIVPSITGTTEVSCNGGSNGRLLTSTVGGTSPYTYSWSNGRTTANIIGLSAGTYTLTVTDKLGCIGTVSGTLTQPSIIVIDTSSIPVTCVPGSATATPSGGTPYKASPPYSYLWSNLATTATASGLGVGTYTVTVSDSLGCSVSTNVTVTTSGMVINLTQTGVLCNGGSTGSVFSSVSGGVSPYTYSWSNGKTTTSISGLSAGTYSLTVSQTGGGCPSIASIVVTQPGVLKDTIVNVIPAVELIHYWDFNQTPPTGGAGGDSLGNSVNPLPASFSTIPSTNPHLIFSHTPTDGIMDNLAGPPYAYVNDLHANGNDTAGLAANNLGVRTRNPTKNSAFYWYLPTTGYQDITLDWALSASSNKGAQYLVINYSTNGGTTWNNMTTAIDTFNIHSVYRPDTLLAINSVTTGSNWYPVHMDFSSIAAANNNPDFVIRILYQGSNTTLTSGNNRFDNISVKGEEIPRVLCSGGNSGQAANLVSGGTGPYTYHWSTSSTTDTATNLAPGTNTVTVTDKNGCTATASVSVVNPPALATTVTINNGCHNSNNATATSTPSGGTGPYSWNWSNGNTSNIAQNLSAGSYTVTVTDIHGCTVTASATVTNPALLSVNILPTDVTCHGGSNGLAFANASGGTSPYTYLWGVNEGRSTNQLVSGLSAGIDTVTVTDANGCSASTRITLSQPAVLFDSVSSNIGVSCNGLSTGSATMGIRGGTTPYTYNWSNGATTAMASGLSAGTYSVSINDVNGCGPLNLTGIVITEPSTLTAGSSVISNASACANVGSASITPGGGTTPYTYLWSNSATTINATGLSAGSYSVTLTDKNGCSASASVTITAPGAVIATGNLISNTTGCSNVGSASVNGGGGLSPYTYLWSNSTTTTNNTGLSAGTYSVTVTDNNGCTATASVTITGPGAVTANGTVISNTTECSNVGSASVTAGGGTTPYTYLWSNSNTTTNTTGLSAGNYSVTITDNSGCSATASVTITAPAAVTASGIINNNASACANNGSASVSVGGGLTPYTYLWSNSITIATASGLSAGAYTVTVTDHGGCTASASITITAPAAVTANATVNNNASACANNGSASVIAGGGISPYNYNWTSGSTISTATGLSAGNYIVTVTDNNGCSGTASVTITAPAAVTSSAAVNSNTTACSNIGSATVTPGGGTTPYTYQWTGGNTNVNATGLSAGSYTVTVKDKNGCSATASITITAPAVVTASGTVISNTTECSSNGSAQVTAGGGLTPYTYNWTSGSTTSSATALSAGNYTVTVSDNNGCSATASIHINAPNALNANGSVISNATACADDGTALVNVSGGLTPYTYSWTSGSTNYDATGLSAGSYTITVTDNSGCTSTSRVTINAPGPVTAGGAVNNNASSCANDGSATVTPGGGRTPYTYSWLPSGGSNATATGLSVGTYTVTVTDANGCDNNTTVVITAPAAISMTQTTVTASAGTCNGSSWVTVVGGVAPYTYSWSPGGATTDTINAVCPGSYCCTVTDKNGCADSICTNVGTGIQQIENASSINVYPDPTNGSFTVSGLIKGQMVEVYNSVGQKLSSGITDRASMQFNIANQPNGVYLIRIINSEGTIVETRKIVKTQ